MKFEYDDIKNILKFENWKASWKASPIYLIRCKCGTPVKAYFAGSTPLNKAEMDSIGFGNIYGGSSFKLITHTQIGWGFWTKDTCSQCNKNVFIAHNDLAATIKFIKNKLQIRNAEISEKKAQDLLDRIKRDARVKQYLNIKTEEILNRKDAALIVSTGSYRDKEYAAILEGLRLTYSEEDYWTEGRQIKAAHYELESSILAAHGTECTCNLCME